MPPVLPWCDPPKRDGGFLLRTILLPGRSERQLSRRRRPERKADRDPSARSYRVLLDYLIRPQQYRGRNGEPERLRGLEIDGQVISAGPFDRQRARYRALEETIHVRRGSAVIVVLARAIRHQPAVLD